MKTSGIFRFRTTYKRIMTKSFLVSILSIPLLPLEALFPLNLGFIVFFVRSHKRYSFSCGQRIQSKKYALCLLRLYGLLQENFAIQRGLCRSDKRLQFSCGFTVRTFRSSFLVQKAYIARIFDRQAFFSAVEIRRYFSENQLFVVFSIWIIKEKDIKMI